MLFCSLSAFFSFSSVACAADEVTFTACDTGPQLRDIVDTVKRKGSEEGFARYNHYLAIPNDQGEPTCGPVPGRILSVATKIKAKDPPELLKFGDILFRCSILEVSLPLKDGGELTLFVLFTVPFDERSEEEEPA